MEHSEESVVDWAYKGKRKFKMVTEVWAEPQFGRLTDLNSELKYLEGLQYNQVPNAVSFNTWRSLHPTTPRSPETQLQIEHPTGVRKVIGLTPLGRTRSSFS